MSFICSLFIGLFNLLIYLLTARNFVQANVTPRIFSFKRGSAKCLTNAQLLRVEDPWLEFTASRPSILSVLNENMIFIPNLKSCNFAGSRLERSKVAEHDQPVVTMSAIVSLCQHL
jgi:hypothetical protein